MNEIPQATALEAAPAATATLTLPLLKKPEEGPWHEFTCPNSLREVEPSAAVLLDDGDRA